MSVQLVTTATTTVKRDRRPKWLQNVEGVLPIAFLTVASITMLLVVIRTVFHADHFWIKEILNGVILLAVPLSIADFCRMGISKAEDTFWDNLFSNVLIFIQVVGGYLGFITVLVLVVANDIKAVKRYPNAIQEHLVHVKYEDLLVTLGAIATILFLFTLSGDKRKLTGWIWTPIAAIIIFTLGYILASS